MTRLTIASLSVGLLLVPCRPAQAQARATVTPSVTITSGYDENPIWRAGAPTDFVVEIAPALEARRESERLDLFGSYRLGAERFGRYPALTSPAASQRARAGARALLGPATALDVAGGFETTLAPTAFNVETGLPLDPGRAWHGDASVRLAHDFNTRTGIDAAGELITQWLADGGSLRTHAVDAGVRRELSPRDTLELRYEGARHRLEARGGAGITRIMTHAWLVGWARRLTPATTLRLAAGPRLDDGALRPQVEWSIDRTAPVGWLAGLSAARTHAPALGVSELVVLDRVLGHLRFRSADRVETGLRGGLLRNEIGDVSVRIYRLTADIAVPVGTMVSLVIAGGLQWQEIGARGSTLGPVGTVDRAAQIARFGADDRLRRSTVSFSLVIAGPDLRRPAEDETARLVRRRR